MAVARGECGEIRLQAVERAEGDSAGEETADSPSAKNHESQNQEALATCHVHLEGMSAHCGEVAARDAGAGSSEKDERGSPCAAREYRLHRRRLARRRGI